MDVQSPRYLGKGLSTGAVYVACSHSYGTEMLCVRGNDGTLGDYYDNKENRSG